MKSVDVVVNKHVWFEYTIDIGAGSDAFWDTQIWRTAWCKLNPTEMETRIPFFTGADL